MKEPYDEGLADHIDPESCVAGRKVSDEALTGVCAGWVLSREIDSKVWSADVVNSSGRQHRGRRYREASLGSTRSETPCTYRNTLHGTREIPCLARHGGSAT